MSTAFDIELSGEGACTLALSTTALPTPGAPAVCGPYGNVFVSVVGADTFCWRRSLNTERPFAAPSFDWSAERNSERRVSSPPHAPKRAPSRHVVAITSTRVHGANGRLAA